MTEPRDLHDITAGHFGTTVAELIATGTATTGFVPTSTGPGLQPVWAAGSGGGGGSCDHQHTYQRFVAAGDLPETFTLDVEPMWGIVQVSIEGPMADPDDVTVSGADISVDTTAGQVVVIWYAKPCTSGCKGATLPDGPDVIWYYAGTETEFAAATPGAWAEDHLYEPGERIVESTFTFARFPNYSRRSDILANKPDFASVTEGDFVADLDGYWLRLADAFDPSSLPPHAINTDFTVFADDCVFVTAASAVWCAEFVAGYETAAVAPDFATAAAQSAGTDTFQGGGSIGTGFLSRAYTGGSVAMTIDAVPDSNFTETDPANAIVEVTASTTDTQIIVLTFDAVCP